MRCPWQLEKARLAGRLDFGFDKDDTRFDDVQVRLDALDTRLVKRLLPDVELRARRIAAAAP